MENRQTTNRKNIKKDIAISFEELMNEIENMRKPQEPYNKRIATEEQIKFIKKCRLHPKPLPYNRMVKLWDKRWGKISKTGMKNICVRVLNG
jgi:hypothetical protein